MIKNIDSTTRVAIVVPAYNEEELIVATIHGIPDWVDKIMIIDDASKDNTYNIIKNEMISNPKIIAIHHERNRGVGGAIKSGLTQFINSDCDIMAIMAGDNQMDPNYLEALIRPIIENKTDITKGNRLDKKNWKGMSYWRILGNFLLTFMTRFAIGYWEISDPQNGYVAASKQAIKKMKIDDLYEGYNFENDFMLKAKLACLRMTNVDIPARYGKEKSGIKYVDFILRTLLYLSRAYITRRKAKL